MGQGDPGCQHQGGIITCRRSIISRYAKMSTHETYRTSGDVRLESVKWVKADIDKVAVTNRDALIRRANSSTGNQHPRRRAPYLSRTTLSSMRPSTTSTTWRATASTILLSSAS